MGTKSRIAPGILKVVERKSTWRPVLPAIERKILNTKPDCLVQDFTLNLPALHPLAGLGRGATGAVVGWRTAFLTQ